jgi:hypothetical protein
MAQAKLIKRRGQGASMLRRFRRARSNGREWRPPSTESELFNPSKDPLAAGAIDHAKVLRIYIWAEEGCARKMDFSKFIVLKQLKSRTRRGVDAESLFVRKTAPHL